MQESTLVSTPQNLLAPSLSVIVTLALNTGLAIDEMKGKSSKVVIVLIHQSIGFCVSASATGG